jgi:hypothetical protein
MPTGTSITYGAQGFPTWVYDLAKHFGLRASTYPGHQESERAEIGFAPNPKRLNRGIDWTGSVENQERFARWLLTIRKDLEQVIWENPQTGRRVGVAGGDDVSGTAYYQSDYSGHRDHVHTRQSKPLPLPTAIEEKPVSWTGDPIWLADVLKAQKPAIKVSELPDWQSYGHGDYGHIWGVMIHHTGNAGADAMSIRNGRPDLEGPLSNLHIAQDGTVTVVAAGVCWHAGRGSYPGIPTDGGNQVLIGIECAWPRDTSITPATQTRERWPDAQIFAMRDSVAAILNKLGFAQDRVIAHKEYAGQAQGKWDPGNLDMGWFRGEVKKAQRGDFKPKARQLPRDFTDRELLEDIWQQLLAIRSAK